MYSLARMEQSEKFELFVVFRRVFVGVPFCAEVNISFALVGSVIHFRHYPTLPFSESESFLPESLVKSSGLCKIHSPRAAALMFERFMSAAWRIEYRRTTVIVFVIRAWELGVYATFKVIRLFVQSYIKIKISIPRVSSAFSRRDYRSIANEDTVTHVTTRDDVVVVKESEELKIKIRYPCSRLVTSVFVSL